MGVQNRPPAEMTVKLRNVWEGRSVSFEPPRTNREWPVVPNRMKKYIANDVVNTSLSAVES